MGKEDFLKKGGTSEICMIPVIDIFFAGFVAEEGRRQLFFVGTISRYFEHCVSGY